MKYLKYIFFVILFVHCHVRGFHTGRLLLIFDFQFIYLFILLTFVPRDLFEKPDEVGRLDVLLVMKELRRRSVTRNGIE